MSATDVLALPVMADLGDPVRVIEVTPLESPVPSEAPMPERTPVEEPEHVEAGR